MPRASPVRIVKQLTAAGYNADREAVTLLAGAPDPDRAVETLLDQTGSETVTITAGEVREVLNGTTPRADDTTVSGGGETNTNHPNASESAAEVKGVEQADQAASDRSPRDPAEPIVHGDMTGESTGTGEYEDFVSVFRDRYERLSAMLRGRVKHRPTDALESMPGGSEGALIGLVTDIRSTRNGHWLVELEDTNGTFPALVMKDREFATAVEELLLDEVIAVQGTLSDDG
ncbi:MAG: DNA-directed DNA polymerase II small subunit, partial [Halobacteriota archaeon]